MAARLFNRGAGPLVYVGSDLAVAQRREAGVTLVAVVPGLSTVELVDSETGIATQLKPPQSAVVYPLSYRNSGGRPGCRWAIGHRDRRSLST